MRPPPVSDHLTSWMVAYVWDTRILIGYATTSRKRPPDILVGRLWEFQLYLHRIRGTLILIWFAIHHLSHSMKLNLHFSTTGKRYPSIFEQKFPPLGKVIRVDNVKIANEVRVHP